MLEPHQRTQSGKLRKATIYNKTVSSETRYQHKKQQLPGIENATNIQDTERTSSVDNYQQTPTVLTDVHIFILNKVAAGYGIKDKLAIDRSWRRTWNIGIWNIPGKLSISINIMQPNINQSWADIDSSLVNISKIREYASEFKDYNLPSSGCNVTGINTVKIQGRWTIHVIQRLIDEKIITLNKIKFSNLNIGDSRLFCWVILGSGSEYLCTITTMSISILVKYLPDWCRYINEINAGNNTTLRVVNPDSTNDASQMTINPYGYIRYNGKIESVSKLPEALSIAIKSVVKSKHSKLFFQSLEYKKV